MGHLLALAAVGWLALVVTAPMAPAPVAALAYGVGAYICHQLPERSLHLGAFQLPVCARCLGLYAGAALGALVPLVGGRLFGRARPPIRSLVGVAAVPTLLTLLLEWSGAWFPSNAQRLMAALPLGAAAAFMVVRAAATVDYAGCPSSRPTETHPPRHT